VLQGTTDLSSKLRPGFIVFHPWFDSHGGVEPQEGAQDVEGIGLLMTCGVEYIRFRLPSAFVFENVKALSYTKHASFFERILAELSSIKDASGKAAYHVHWKAMNSKFYGGVPQSRPRIFIVGILQAKQRHPFKWPCKMKRRPIDAILGPPDRKQARAPDLSMLAEAAVCRISESIEKIQNKGGKPLTETWFVDCYASPSRAAVHKDICPCLTKARAGAGGFYVTNRGATLTAAHMLKLQGMSPQRILRPKGVSERQFRSAIGNAVTVPVLARITLNICKSLAYVCKSEKVD
jgi:site-specific DNA-cytosine methylase